MTESRNFKIVLHAHSTWSYDGRWRLPAIAKLFGSFSIDAVLMTEHDTGFDPNSFERYRDECLAASTARCAIIPGIEYSSPNNDVHILTWGLKKFLGEHRQVENTLRDVQQLGGVAIFAHPIRRDAWKLFRPDWRRHLHGIEIWNRKSDGLAPSSVAAKLREETGLPATVGADFHRSKQLFPLYHEMTMARYDGIESAVVEAIREGKLMPMAAGRPLLTEGGKLDYNSFSMWRKLEKTRRFLRHPFRNQIALRAS